MPRLKSSLIAITTLVAVAGTSLPAHAASFRCTGTEPFWDLTINGSRIVLDEANSGKSSYRGATLKWIGSTRLYTAKPTGKAPSASPSMSTRSARTACRTTVTPTT